MSQKDKETHLSYIEAKGKFTIACNRIIFAPQEIELLEKYGHWFEALTGGTLSPFNSEQEHFIEAVKGARPPETDHEKVWSKYVKRKDIEKKYGPALYTRPVPADDTFYSREMVTLVHETMFKVNSGYERNRR